MKKIIINILLILFILVISGKITPVYAVNQAVTVDFPSVNNVTVSSGSFSSTIDPSTGILNSELNSIFDVSTNDKHGLMADFTVKVDTLSGLINGATGTVSGSNEGTCVLTNNDFKPNSASVGNALISNASPSNNPNVIGFEIVFENQTNKGDDPVFNSLGSTVATGEVLHKKGNTSIIARVRNNTSINHKTFGNSTDTAGFYQLTIYCTVYNP